MVSVIDLCNMEIAGYLAALLIGLSLGLTGGGGSILTVPVLVYLFGIEPVLATTYSLFIVGATSLVGGVRAYMFRQVDFKAVSLFGIPSIFSIFIARHFVLPELPDVVFSIGTHAVAKGTFLMLVFALLMFVSAFFMMRPQKDPEISDNEDTIHRPLLLLIPGLVVGFVTGLLGAGGGFMIIPALVLLLKIPMRKAIGTSLHIIAINSLFGFLFSMKQTEFNWNLLLISTALAIAGVLAGVFFSKKINNRLLKILFGWFVLLMSVAILIKELVFPS